MALTVRRSKGVIVEFNGEGVAFDPSSITSTYPAFVTHAHADHAMAFKNPEIFKYVTEPTQKLLETMRWAKFDNWRKISVGDVIKIGELEVKPHNAGHVLGAVQFEVKTPEGIVLYTGDFSLGNSYTMEPAEAVGCDIMIIETTFGAPMFKFPKRKDVAMEMVRWAVMEAIPAGLIPTFRADSIGNAQEIIYIFNSLTMVPVVTLKSVTRVSDVYREYGHNLDYIDASSSEGHELIESGKCILITPKGAKLKYDNLDTALVSGWATIMRKRSRAFPLSDHADFGELIRFIKRCHPKRVLTFHGGAMTRGFPEYVRKRLKIDARPLTNREETLMGTVSHGEIRMKACIDQLIRVIRIPGFEYTSLWLVKEMARRGFTRSETEAALKNLLERNIVETTRTGVKLA